MQKWEYLFLYKSGEYWSINDRQVGITRNCWLVDEKGNISIFDMLNKIGDEGWELVTEFDYTRFIFKRPKLYS